MARSFRFRLETLKKLREQVRDERRQRYEEALAADEKLVERLNELAQEAHGLRDTANSARTGGLDVEKLLETERYLTLLQAEARTVVGHRQTLAQEINTRREALLAADRGVRVLENLKDKQQERFQQELRQEEQKFLDEVAGRPRGVNQP